MFRKDPWFGDDWTLAELCFPFLAPDAQARSVSRCEGLASRVARMVVLPSRLNTSRAEISAGEFGPRLLLHQKRKPKRGLLKQKKNNEGDGHPAKLREQKTGLLAKIRTDTYCNQLACPHRTTGSSSAWIPSAPSQSFRPPVKCPGGT